MSKSSPKQHLSTRAAARAAASSMADTWVRLAQAVVIVVIGTAVFWPALHGTWIWDDQPEVSLNTLLRAPDGWWKFWIAPTTPDYFPLKSTLQWLLWQAWQDNAMGFHVVSLGLHLVSALLLVRVLRQLGLRHAWLGGLLFAIHPVVVESVAWIAELKNTVSLPPLLLAMSAYLEYDARRQARDYGRALLWFLAAMLCKTSVVMLPAVLLLYAWWKRGRIGRDDMRASAPFFAVSLALGLVTMWFQQHHSIGTEPLPTVGLPAQVARAGLALGFYLGKCVCPVGLVPVYPRWAVEPPSLLQFTPWLLLGAVGFAAWRRRATWGRHVLFGLGFFGLNLAPVLGFAGMSYLRFSWVADHFVYLPLLGVVGLAVAGADALANRLSSPLRRYAIGGVALVLVALAAQTYRYSAVYQSETTFWTYTLARNPDVWQGQYDLGIALLSTRQPVEAVAHFEQALRLNPRSADTHYNLANALAQLHRMPDAIRHYEESLRLQPASADAQCNLGNALLEWGQATAALEHLAEAVRLSPGISAMHANYANALNQTGHAGEAAAQFGEALRLDPNDGLAHYNYGNLLLKAGRTHEAIDQYEAALRLLPENDAVRHNLNIARQSAGLVSPPGMP
jgi:tetratricopeptide (TPR) repeat protein